MDKNKKPRICPAEIAGSLDNPFRRLVHKPGKILGPYVTEGMTVIDLGCGPGYFTTGLARLVGDGGRVIAADLQQAMLEKVMRKIKGTDLEQRILIHKCQEDKIGVSTKVDFVLAFWMVHELSDQQRLFEELNSILNPGGRFLIIEPKIHVTEKSFKEMISRTESAGFEIIERPKVSLSRAVLLVKECRSHESEVRSPKSEVRSRKPVTGHRLPPVQLFPLLTVLLLIFPFLIQVHS